MDMFSRLRAENAGLKIESVHDTAFARYGRILPFSQFACLAARAAETPVPSEGNTYVADDRVLCSPEAKAALELAFFGVASVQTGWCNGQSSRLNALEYHKSTEINVAVTGLVLILGRSKDVCENKYDAARAEIFFLPANTAVELYAGTLHFSPCRVLEDGFRALVLLPLGTNGDLTAEELMTARAAAFQETRLLMARNKWLIAHPEAKHLLDKGAFPGICGDNIEIKPIK